MAKKKFARLYMKSFLPDVPRSREHHLSKTPFVSCFEEAQVSAFQSLGWEACFKQKISRFVSFHPASSRPRTSELDQHGTSSWAPFFSYVSKKGE
jgi:hypothetical protein